MKNKADERFNVCYSQVGEMLSSFVCMYMVDRGFDSQLGQTKDYEIAVIRSNTKDWLNAVRIMFLSGATYPYMVCGIGNHQYKSVFV